MASTGSVGYSEVGFGKAIVQVFEGTTGLTITGTKAKFLGKTMEMPVSQEAARKSL